MGLDTGRGTGGGVAVRVRGDGHADSFVNPIVHAYRAANVHDRGKRSI
jgi:hypothetical protein